MSAGITDAPTTQECCPDQAVYWEASLLDPMQNWVLKLPHQRKNQWQHPNTPRRIILVGIAAFVGIDDVSAACQPGARLR